MDHVWEMLNSVLIFKELNACSHCFLSKLTACQNDPLIESGVSRVNWELLYVADLCVLFSLLDLKDIDEVLVPSELEECSFMGFLGYAWALYCEGDFFSDLGF